MAAHGPGVRLVCVVTAAALLVPLAPRAAAPVRGLTDASRLARILDLTYDADVAGAEAELARACGPAPAVACDVLRAVLLWWRIYPDVENRSRDQVFTAAAATAIDRAERWTAREPERAEAWFYLGAAYGARVQYRSWRKEYLAGARDGKRVKVALERALQLDPAMHDANFGIGLYQYYADIAPAILKMFRWLFALPGGNRVQGMQRMLQTRSAGTLMRSEAAYQLYLIDIWYEHRGDRARTYLEELRARYPHNPLFLLNLAQLDEVYRNDRPAALAAYGALVGGAQSGGLREPALAETWGRRGVAAQLDALAETDRAIDELRTVIAKRPSAPLGVAALTWLDLGRAFDRLGDRTRAVDAYRAALAAVPSGDPDGVRARVEAGLRQKPDPVRAEAYRLSIDGWRALERQAVAEAGRAIERSLQLAPADGVTWYRRGRWHLAAGDRQAALADFERALQLRPRPPAPFIARSHLEAGHLQLAAGRRDQAAAHYDNAVRVVGADPKTRAAAVRARADVR